MLLNVDRIQTCTDGGEVTQIQRRCRRGYGGGVVDLVLQFITHSHQPHMERFVPIGRWIEVVVERLHWFVVTVEHRRCFIGEVNSPRTHHALRDHDDAVVRILGPSHEFRDAQRRELVSRTHRSHHLRSTVNLTVDEFRRQDPIQTTTR
ncbi:hypothetical protein D3C86_1630710 [compost metagenome]